MESAANLPAVGRSEIVVSGHLCIDMYPAMNMIAPEALTTPGRLYEVGPMAMSTGGCVSNTGLSLYRLGMRVGLMATVGDDWLGQATIGILRSLNPSLGDLIRVQAGIPSSYSVVLSPGGADRTFLHCTGPNTTFDAANIAYDQLNGVKIFHLGYPPLLPRLVENDGAELQRIFERVRALGCVTSLDMVVPDPQSFTGRANWRRILSRVLPWVDVFVPSIDEMLLTLRRDFIDQGGDTLKRLSAAFLRELADELLSMGAPLVGFKLGRLGMYLKTGPASRFEHLARLGLRAEEWADGEFWQPAFQVEVKGTTGAGDSAYAGFLTALLHRQTPAEALRWACATGACNVEAVDSNSGVQPLPAILARLVAGWPNRPERLAGFAIGGESALDLNIQ